MAGTTTHYHIFDTAAGACGIAWTAAGVCRFQLPAEDRETARRLLTRRLADARPAEPPPAVAEAVAGAQRYFSGEATDFSAVPLDLSGAEPFFLIVYAAARRLGWGETTSYGALARELDAGPEGARLVGQAMAQNPVALIIPCHRVLAAHGRIGGFSAPGGAAAKERMLMLEGVSLAASAQQSFAF